MAARVLALDPRLGGATLIGPADAWLDVYCAAAGTAQRIPSSADAEALEGGLDALASLAAGRPMRRAGLLAGSGPVLLAHPDLLGPAATAILARADRPLLLLGDAPALTEAAPIRLDLQGLRPDPATLRARLAADTAPPVAAPPAPGPPPTLPPPIAEAMAAATLQLGIPSLRRALAAARFAAAAAALGVAAEDAVAAALRLVLLPAARQLPADPAEPQSAPPEPSEPTAPADGDVLLEAAFAAIPPDLLAALAAPSRAAGAGAGRDGTGAGRGRPLPGRPGRPRRAADLDLTATLRAAVPWQRLRGRAGGPLRLRPDDLRLRRTRHRASRLTVFAIDASGSAALGRLAEAKGAVETLLAEAYVGRQHVAVIAFRGTAAELLLPPTRALAAAKKGLAGLPGGGPTPLAAGLALALETAERGARAGLQTALVVLTDGRANIARDGQPDRARAEAEAKSAARAIQAEAVPALVVDTGGRPGIAARRLAQDMGARHLTLPPAAARALAGAARDLLP